MKKIIITALLAVIGLGAKAQIDLNELLQAGVDDANTLAKPYLNPFGEMLGASLNNGWYNSAKTHKLLGFDVTFTATYVKAPSGAKSFDVSKLDLKQYELVPGSSSITPTFAGESDTRAEIRKQGDITNLTSFTLPNGTGMDFLPVPMVSAGIGLPMGIELKGRFIPQLKLGDAGKLGLWGLGVQKDIKDYIPGVKHVPVLNMSVLMAYTKFSSSIDVPGEVEDNGSLDIDAGAFTSRLIIGVNLPIVAFYTGLGYGRTSSDFALKGSYEINGMLDPVSNPIDLNYGVNSFNMNVGMRLRLGVIALHADYTLGEYSAITGGFGISFR